MLCCGNRNASARGIRLPFDNARFLKAAEGNYPDFQPVEAAIAEFRSRHPYLLFDKRATTCIRQRANLNPKLLARLEASLREKGSGSVKQELRTRIKHQARRLIHTSFLALISDGTTREDALQATRIALSGFTAGTSWKARPVIKSFLDCAEIAVAVSLAYDWLYEELSDDERQVIEESLFRHVLEPALAAYNDRFALWPKRRDNCTLVSNSGILVASLAVLERYPEASVQLIRKSISSSWSIFAALAPDGAWPEGLSYWSLAMRYAGLMVATLESTFGQSLGLADLPGFAQTGDFALHAVGPFGAAFNFGDWNPNSTFRRSPGSHIASSARSLPGLSTLMRAGTFHSQSSGGIGQRPIRLRSIRRQGRSFTAVISPAFEILGQKTRRLARSMSQSRVEMSPPAGLQRRCVRRM